MNPTQAGPTVVALGEDVLERMVLAVELVRERLRRATGALEAAGVKYAVVGGHAVAAWVSRVDPAAVRNTADVDLLIERADFDRVKAALATAGFVHHESLDVNMFLDGPNGRPRDAVHVVFAGEKVRENHAEPAPSLAVVEPEQTFHVVGLESLVRMKLTSFRDKDRMHLRDMIEVGLLDDPWLSRLPAELATRLKELLDNPEG